MKSVDELVVAERDVFKFEDGKVKMEKIKADESYHEYNKIYDYKCEFGTYMDIFEDMIVGNDTTDDLFKVMNAPGDLRMEESDNTRDSNGRIYSGLETGIMENVSFRYILEPSIGTISRYKKTHMSSYHLPGSVVLLFIQPPDNSEDYIVDEFKLRKGIVTDFARNEGFYVYSRDVTWNSLPKDGTIYMGWHGWKLHELDVVGIGLEFNPHVGNTYNISLLRYTRQDNYYDVTYIRNNRTYDMKYYYVPKCFRVHGGEYAVRKRKQLAMVDNLFNVVSTARPTLSRSCENTTILDYAHCCERVVVPRIVGFQNYHVNGVSWELGLGVVDGELVPVDVVSPGFELSTRRKILRELGWGREYNITDSYSVLSSVGSYYLNFDTYDRPIGKKYKFYSLDFPSKWFFSGCEFVLRAYPLAVRLLESDIGDIIVNNLKYIQSDEGRWFSCVNGVWSPIVKSPYYDKNLIVHIPDGNFVRGGKMTLMFEPDDEGESFVKIYRPSLVSDSVYLTIKKCDKVFQEVNVKSKIEYKNIIIYEFHSRQACESCYKLNSLDHSSHMWFGDLMNGYDILEPMNKKHMLVRDTHNLGSCKFSFPLTMEYFYHNSEYDAVGNYYLINSGEVYYDVWNDEDINWEVFDSSVDGVIQ